MRNNLEQQIRGAVQEYVNEWGKMHGAKNLTPENLFETACMRAYIAMAGLIYQELFFALFRHTRARDKDWSSVFASRCRLYCAHARSLTQSKHPTKGLLDLVFGLRTLDLTDLRSGRKVIGRPPDEELLRQYEAIKWALRDLQRKGSTRKQRNMEELAIKIEEKLTTHQLSDYKMPRLSLSKTLDHLRQKQKLSPREITLRLVWYSAKKSLTVGTLEKVISQQRTIARAAMKMVIEELKDEECDD
jgi:hypothetical protein